MSNSCQLKITTDFKAPLWEWCGMLAGGGYIYVKTAVFKDGSEVAIDITADTFSLEIKDSDGTVVDTLTLGAGLTVVSTNKLNIAAGPPVTDTADTYTGVLVWTRASTTAVIPTIMFTFLIE